MPELYHMWGCCGKIGLMTKKEREKKEESHLLYKELVFFLMCLLAYVLVFFVFWCLLALVKSAVAIAPYAELAVLLVLLVLSGFVTALVVKSSLFESFRTL